VTIKVKLLDLSRVGISAKLFHDEMQQWRAHMAFVEAEKNFPLNRPDRSRFDTAESFDKAIERYDAEMFQRHVPYPGPHMDRRFTFMVTEETEPYYEIIDDTGDAGATLPKV
jgi:hypothetical protein